MKIKKINEDFKSKNNTRYDGLTTDWNSLTDIKNWISISELKDKLGWNE